MSDDLERAARAALEEAMKPTTYEIDREACMRDVTRAALLSFLDMDEAGPLFFAVLGAHENYCGHLADYTTIDGEPYCSQCVLEARETTSAVLKKLRSMASPSSP